MPHPSLPEAGQSPGLSTAFAVSPLKVLLHDLKNPLAHIQSTTGLLRLLLEERQGETGDYEQYLEILDLSARRAQLLLQRAQLLDQLRISQVPCRLQSQPLHRIAQETARLYRIWAFQRKLQLDLILEPIWVCADEGFLTQIVDNLLSNAIQHSRSAGRIEIHVGHWEGQGRLQIRDQGPGLTAGQRETLFQPQAGRSSSEPPSGLGLAISKQLCDLMQGRIDYQASAGGSTFEVCLPLAAH